MKFVVNTGNDLKVSISAEPLGKSMKWTLRTQELTL